MRRSPTFHVGLVVALLVAAFLGGAIAGILTPLDKPPLRQSFEHGYVRFVDHPGPPNRTYQIDDVQSVTYYDQYVQIQCMITSKDQKHSVSYMIPKENLI